MSEASPASSDSSPGPASAPPPAAAPGPVTAPEPPRKRRWLRRIRITLLVLLILCLVLRIALNYLLPSVLRKVAAGYDLDCTFERSELSLLGGDFGLWHLEIKPKGGGESLLQAGYCRGNVSVWALMQGRLEIWRLEADGAEVSVERLSDGRIPLLERFVKPDAQARRKSAKATTAGGEKAEEFQLVSSLKIDALRVQQLKVRLRDRAVTPPVETTILATLRVSDLGSVIRPMKTELNIEASGVLDTLVVRAQRGGDAGHADVDTELIVRGLRARGLAGYLEPLGIHPVAEGINAHASGKARIVLTTQPAGAPPTFAGHLAFHDVAITADGETAAAIKSLKLDVNSANSGSANLGTLAIDGVRLAGRRTATGHVRIAGLEFVSQAPGSGTKPAGPASGPSPETRGAQVALSPSTVPARKVTATRASAFQLLFSDVRIRDVRLEFADELQSPPLQLAVLLDDLSTKDLVVDAAGHLPALNLTGTARVPGVLSMVKLDGSIQPFTPRKSIDLSLTATGIAPELLRPYLLAAGLEPTLKSGTLWCAIQSDFELDSAGRLIGQAHIKSMKLTDGSMLFELGDTAIRGFAADPVTGRIRLETVVINGPSIPIKRQADGRFSLLGFRNVPASAGAASPSTPARQATAGNGARSSPPPSTLPSEAAGFPRLEIGKLTWNNLRLDLSDDTTRPPTATSLTDVGLEITNLALDTDPNQPVSQPGRIKAHLSALNLAKTLSVEGTIAAHPDALSLDLSIGGDALSAATIQSYLQPLGIQPTFQDGKLQATARLNVKRGAGATAASLWLTNVKLADGSGELASVEAVSVRDLLQKPGLMSVGDIQVVRPHAKVVREQDGTLIVAGVKLLKAPAPPLSAKAAVTSPAAVRPTGVSAPPGPASLPSPAPASVTGLSKVRVTDATLVWTDRAMTPAITSTLRGSIEVDQLILGSNDAKPSLIKVTASADRGLKDLTITGTVLAAPRRQSASVEIAASGIAPAAVYAYLPPEIQIATQEGRLKASLDAGVSENPAGGTSVKVRINAMDYRDGAAAVPLFKLDSLTVIAPRIDPAKNLIAIDEISVAGLEADVRLDPENVVRVLGLKIQPPPASAVPSGHAASRPAEAPRVAATQAAPSPGAPEVAALLSQGRKTPTTITAEKLDLHIRRASVTDANRPAAAPITVSDLRFRNLGRIEWAGADAASRPPTRFELTGRIDPVVTQFKLSAAVAPFAHQPAAQLDLLASGIKGEGLMALRPELKGTLDGSKLTDGRLTAHLETTLTLERRGAGNLDPFTLGEELQKGFAADVVLKNLEYRADPNGPVLAGLEEFRMENAQVRPKTGGVIIKSLEITKPRGSVTRDAQGIHALGWTLKDPASPPTTRPATQAAPAPVVHAAPATRIAAAGAPATRAATAAPSTRPAAEIRIDQLIVSGLDLKLEDTTSTPPLVLPLTGLDVDVKGLSNFAFYEERPIRFTALMSSGKVPLPRRPKGAGIPGLIADLASGEKAATRPVLEQREFFSQITASGNVTLYPRFRGWVKTAVNGFEVAGLAGPAKQAGGVTLGGGVFDSNVDLRFGDDDKIDVKSRHVFTDLLMSEPKDGPIARNLKLAGGLDAAIRALQDVDGSITLPVRVQVADGKIQGLGGAAVSAVGGVIATAIASAPVKVVAGVGELIGLGGSRAPGVEEPRTIQFRPGYAGLEPEQTAAVSEVIRKMRSNATMEITLRHELGGGDIPVAEARANPPSADAAELAYQLRYRKIELTRARSEVAGLARAQLAYQVGDRTPASIDQLRAIDRELAQTEDALDKVYELMRPGAERQGARRTRQAAIEFGKDRLEAVRSQLLASGLPGIARRVCVLNPGFNPSDDGAAGGKVIVVLVAKKRQQ